MTDKDVEKFLEAKERINKISSTLILKEYINTNTPLKVYCTNCKQIFTTYMKVIKDNHGLCPCCEGNVIVKGYNTFGDKYPDLVKYLKNKEDAYKYSYGSGEKVKVKCCECGIEINIILNQLSKRGFSCPICSDKISLPNRILRAFLKLVSKQVEEYEFEKRFDWSQGKIYDGYFIKNNQRYLIEMQGEQHYKNAWNSKEVTQNNDKLKEKLAKENGFELIIINCKNSDFHYIKNNIMNSKLGNIFSIRKRNWDTIFKEATSSLVVKVAELYNNGMTSPTQIGRELKIHRKTAQNYIEKASQLNMIVYKKKINPIYSINVYNLNYNLLFSNINLKECIRNLDELKPRTHLETIKKYCNTNIPYHGYYFYFADSDPNIQKGT